jgi:glycerol-3-phosphate O-acyltransferase
MRGLFAGASLFRGKYGRLNLQIGELLTMDGMLAELDRHPTKSKKRASLPPPSIPDGTSTARLPTHGLTPARRRAMVTHLAYRVMNEINRVTAVTPGALVATALLTHGKRGISHADLEQACVRIASILHGFGARFGPSLTHPQTPDGIRIEAIREACDLFVRAGNVQVRAAGGAITPRGKKLRAGRDAIYVVPDEARLSLDLSKNIVIHFFLSRAMIATCLLAPPGTPTETEPLRERVRALSRLFKYEFQFRADAPFEQIFDETIAAMVASGELARRGDGESARSADRSAPGAIDIANSEDARANVVLYAQVVRNFVEGYRIAARALAPLLKGPLLQKDLVKRALVVGERMFLAGEIERREAVSRPLFENAHGAFVDQGYLTRDDGKLRLADSYDSQAAMRTIEPRIAGFLPPVT